MRIFSLYFKIFIIQAVVAVAIIIFLTIVRFADNRMFVDLIEEYRLYSQFDTSVNLVLDGD